MSGMREARETEEQQNRLLQEMRTRHRLRRLAFADEECKKQREKLEAEGWPPREVEARVSELKLDILSGTYIDKFIEDLFKQRKD